MLGAFRRHRFTQFTELQRQLALTEDRIQAARRFFNANTREMNQLCEAFPTNIVAGIFGFQAGSYFELDSQAERVVASNHPTSSTGSTTPSTGPSPSMRSSVRASGPSGSTRSPSSISSTRARGCGLRTAAP